MNVGELKKLLDKVEDHLLVKFRDTNSLDFLTIDSVSSNASFFILHTKN